METFEITGSAQPEETRSYRMIPFTVPPGTRRVAVMYAYGGDAGARGAKTGTTVDIGIFDARPGCARVPRLERESPIHVRIDRARGNAGIYAGADPGGHLAHRPGPVRYRSGGMPVYRCGDAER